MKEHNFIFVEAAMENKVVVSLVERASDSIWHRLPDVTSFEHTCYVNIGKELLRKEVTSVAAMATHYIKRATARHLKRSKYDPPRFFSDLAIAKGQDEEDAEYEVEDALASVEEGFILAETQEKVINLLAQDDYLNRVILNAWASGYTNATELSGILADTIGGKTPGAFRKSIQRFRKECCAVRPALAI